MQEFKSYIESIDQKKFVNESNITDSEFKYYTQLFDICKKDKKNKTVYLAVSLQITSD